MERRSEKLESVNGESRCASRASRHTICVGRRVVWLFFRFEPD